jgi:hypothetical protein
VSVGANFVCFVNRSVATRLGPQKEASFVEQCGIGSGPAHIFNAVGTFTM